MTSAWVTDGKRLIRTDAVDAVEDLEPKRVVPGESFPARRATYIRDRTAPFLSEGTAADLVERIVALEEEHEADGIDLAAYTRFPDPRVGNPDD